MAEKTGKSFNLIKKEVQLKKNVKVERDWYTLFNILIICMVVILSAISYLAKLTIKSGIDKKTEDLANNINNNLNTVSKSLTKGRIDVLTDKFTIYQDFLVQNFDSNKFYKDVTSLYPNIKIDRFRVRPDSEIIETNLRLETNGYNDLAKIIQSLKSSQEYKVSTIKNISFELTEVDAANAKDTSLVNKASETSKFVTLITVDFQKNNLKTTQNAN